MKDNILTEKELEIVGLFRKDPFKDYTIREVMKKIGTKSYNWTHTAIKKLQKQDIISLQKKGQSQLCSINMDSQKSIIYLTLSEELNALKQKIPNLHKVIKLMPLHFHILIITGSYANRTFTEKSDLDVVVVLDKKEEKKWVLNKLSSEGDLMIPQLHPYVFTKEEFLEMLTNKEANYGKEIEKKHLIVSGAESYYGILKEAIANGYRR
jgi:predicted nucleotidyltransferase